MNASDCLKDPVEALNLNAVATTKILQSAIKMGVKKFLYISSIHVYKDKLQGSISELDHQPTSILMPQVNELGKTLFCGPRKIN